MRDPLRHHSHREESGTFPERIAGAIAERMGTWQFLAFALFGIGAWLAVNGLGGFAHAVARAAEHGHPFDPPPWILLNLLFSFEAFFTGSLVVIAQRREEKRSLAREAADARHREELAQMHQQTLEAIHDLVRDDTPGGVGRVIEILSRRAGEPVGCTTSGDEW